MSKIGKMPIMIKDGVQVTVSGRDVTATGSKGSGMYKIPEGITVVLEDGKLTVKQVQENDRETMALFGLTRANLANLVKGVDTGFEKKLELTGVGYRAQMQGLTLVLSLGFSHPVKFTPKEGITLSVADNGITVSGMDKMLVGEMAAVIRAAKPPEPYKGKGIHYVGEYIRRKAGKAAKAVGGAGAK